MRTYLLIASTWLCLLAPQAAAVPEQEIRVEPLVIPPVASASLTLTDAEALALASHPAIAEAESRVRAARANRLQVGLPPNPSVGYLGSEIGNEGAGGQQGVYVGQQFIRGNKLQLNRQVASREVRKREQMLTAERLRVLTTVRVLFFDAYLAQREVALSDQLLEVSRQAARSVKQLLEAQEARRIDVLQAEIERDRIAVKLEQARAKQQAAWRQLAVAMGRPDHAILPVAADPSTLTWPHDWQASRQMILGASPEVAALLIEISRARATLARECADPIPDVTAQVSVQYDDATDDTVTGLQLGMPIPLWNRNQGGIGRARHDLTAAKHRLEAFELTLTSKLTERLRQFTAAKAQADAYQQGILARAAENLDLTRQGYDAGEVSYLELLTVQRTYFQTQLDYLDSLSQVNQSVQLLAGFLLERNED